MKKSHFASGAGIGILFIVFLVSRVATNAMREQRPFDIHTVYSQKATVEDALDVSAMTRDFVVSEGPCSGNGCNGGVLSQQSPVDVKMLNPKLGGYNEKTQTILWLYQVKPLQIQRSYDTWGKDSLTIKGHVTRDKAIYFAVVPKQLVEPPLQWVYVETR